MPQENGNKHHSGFSILIGCLHRTIILCSLFIGFYFSGQKEILYPPISPFWRGKCATVPDKVIIMQRSRLPQCLSLALPQQFFLVLRMFSDNVRSVWAHVQYCFIATDNLRTITVIVFVLFFWFLCVFFLMVFVSF